MRRIYRSIDLPDRIRHVVEIFDDSGQYGATRGHQFLHQIVNEDTALLHCGSLSFEVFRVDLIDRVWKITAEANEPKPNARLQ